MVPGVEQLLAFGPLGLFIVAFLESTIFPVPPDVLLLPMCMVAPRLAWWYAFVASSASVLGGLLGYVVGKRAGRPVVRRFLKESSILDVEALFTKYGGWAVGIAAFTPLPYKVFTFGAGIFGVSLWAFAVASVVGRSARFFLEGALVYFLGDRAQAYLGPRFEAATLALTAVLVLGTVLFPKLMSMKRRIVPQWQNPGMTGRRWDVRSLRLRVAALVGSVGRSPIAWGLSAAAFAVLGAAFLEDIPGPEREALNAALDPLFRTPPFSWSALGTASGIWPVTAALGFVCRGMRAIRPPSRGMKYLAWVAALSTVSWAVENGIKAYLLAFYGRASFPAGGPLIAPAFLLLGIVLILERSGLVLRACGIACTTAIGLARSGMLVASGADPVVGMASLIASAFIFCVWSAVLAAPQLSPARL